MCFDIDLLGVAGHRGSMPTSDPPTPDTDRTDAVILDAAEALLAETPTPSMAAVARRAGVSRGTVYRRFADRDALLARVAARRGVPVETLERRPRDRLLDGVGAVLAELGPAGLTVDAVARVAGLGPATVYRHFAGRDALLAAFAAERSPRRLAGMLDASTGDDIEGDLLRMAEAGVGFARAQPGLVRLMLSGRGVEDDSAPLGSGRRARDALVDYFTRQVAAGRLRGDPEAMALAFGATVLALGGHAALEPRDAARFVVGLLLDGLRPP